MVLYAENDNRGENGCNAALATWLILFRENRDKFAVIRAQTQGAELLAMRPHPQTPRAPVVHREPAKKARPAHLSVVK